MKKQREYNVKSTIRWNLHFLPTYTPLEKKVLNLKMLKRQLYATDTSIYFSVVSSKDICFERQHTFVLNEAVYRLNKHICESF